MKVIIVGAGRLGKGLALKLEKKGVEVTLIDKNADVLNQLSCFSGKKVVGIGFDKQVLENAGIQTSDALVSCTDVDETNALIARIGRSIYKVPRVIARLYDSRKATIYNALGIQIVSTTEWGIKHASELLSYGQLDTVLEIGGGEVEIIRVEVPPLMAGTRVKELERPGEVRVVAIRHGNKTQVPVDGTLLQEGDIFYAAVSVASLKAFKQMLGLA